jgi:hypothetical protein
MRLRGGRSGLGPGADSSFGVSPTRIHQAEFHLAQPLVSGVLDEVTFAIDEDRPPRSTRCQHSSEIAAARESKTWPKFTRRRMGVDENPP